MLVRIVQQAFVDMRWNLQAGTWFGEARSELFRQTDFN